MSVQYLILVFVGNANFTTNMCRIDVLWSLSLSEVTENVGTSSASLTGFFKILAHLLGNNASDSSYFSRAFEHCAALGIF